MPGRGGRSKACENCYRRRVKCDETRPKCLKCAKAKLDCRGYRPLTILSYDGNCEQWSKKGTGEENTGSAHDPSGDQPLPDLSVELPIVSNTADGILTFMPLADDVFVKYTLSNLLSARSQYKLVTGVHRDLSDKTFLAFATFFFGNEHKQQEVVHYGLRRYGKVLQKLNLALGDTQKWRTYDVLESVIIATMFEFLMSDRPNGWISHAVGIEQLFDCKGPRSFKSYAERSILERSRPSIIFASLALRKPTILSKRKWKTVPWESAPKTKSLFENLVDIMADCPQLLAVHDKMNAAKGQPIAKTHACELCIQASTLREQLRKWKELWDTTEADYRHERPCELEDLPEGMQTKVGSPDRQQAKFVYKSLYHANAVTLYDATTILLERMLQSTIDVGGIEPQLVETEPESAEAAVCDIVRSADYCIDNARDGLGSFYILFPIRMAWAWASNRDAVTRAWLESTLRRIQLGAAGHWAVAGYLLSIANSSSPPQQKVEAPEAVDNA